MSLTNCQPHRRALLPTLLLLLCSCTSFQAMTLHDARTELVPGQRVRVTKGDGQTLTFRVRSVTEDSLLGDGHAVLYEDVRTLERRQLSPLRTFGLVYMGIGIISFLSSDGLYNFDGLAPGS